MSHKYEDINTRQKVNDELTKFFKPELVNRIDEIVVFDKLKQENLQSIAGQMLKQLSIRLRKKNIFLNVSPDVTHHIISQVDCDKFGARPIRRAVSYHLEDKICDELIKNNIDENVKYDLTVDMVKDSINIKLVSKNGYQIQEKSTNNY